MGARRAHRRDQDRGARHDGDPLGQNPSGDVGPKAREERDALAQRRLEGDLAAHRSLGDGGDRRPRADLGRHLVDALLLDQRRIHVGDQEPFAS